MPYKIRTRQCSYCSNMITGRISPYGDLRCIECALAYQAEWLRDMYFKRGKAYASWLGTRGPLGRPRKNPPRR